MTYINYTHETRIFLYFTSYQIWTLFRVLSYSFSERVGKGIVFHGDWEIEREEKGIRWAKRHHSTSRLCLTSGWIFGSSWPIFLFPAGSPGWSILSQALCSSVCAEGLPILGMGSMVRAPINKAATSYMVIRPVILLRHQPTCIGLCTRLGCFTAWALGVWRLPGRGPSKWWIMSWAPSFFEGLHLVMWDPGVVTPATDL